MKKKIIRMTESDLMGIVSRSVSRILREDVLGDDWREKEESVLNNYEPFEDQKEEKYPFGNEHDWSGQGEEDTDPTFYDDPDYYRDDVVPSNPDPSDGDLYRV